MISQQTSVDPNTGMSPPIGVAQQAVLFSSAFGVAPLGNQQEDAAIAAQFLANGVWAINMSFGLDLEGGYQLDGNSILTQFVDWSTVWHEVVYVVAGNGSGKPPVPTDNFNGITVAASKKLNDGVFRGIDSGGNDYSDAVDAVGVRTSTDILAPGFLIDVAGANGTQPPRGLSTGTSFAAPHVTGTLALLQQRANTTNGRRHQTMKAVLLNSADKIKGIIGMDRTVEKSNGSNWLGSVANSDPMIPEDREMGVGELDAKRAVQQFDGGEHPPGGVPSVGWDYFYQDDPFVPNRYTLSLDAGDYVSATLVWDRELALNSPFLDYQRGDGFIDFDFANLDLFLVPAGQGIEQAVASSTSTAWNLEHIFAPVPRAGNYELWVSLIGGPSTVNYALAWWAGADERPAPGDFNGDGSVNAADYVLWRNDPASYGGDPDGYNTWRANFGNTAGSGSSFAAVPEPAFAALLLLGGAGASLVKIRRRRCG
jgi:subtilisin family serine protease